MPTLHASDCAVHNAPAMDPGPCDCRLAPPAIFYVVWNPAHGLPRYQHATLAEARREAERLARLNPTSEFHVLASVGTARATSVVWDEHIPF